MQFKDLTESEVAIIQSHRAEIAKKLSAKDFQSKAIATAHAFDSWSAQTGEELTFSTFVNSFGYQDKDSRHIYDAVARIFKAARCS